MMMRLCLVGAAYLTHILCASSAFAFNNQNGILEQISCNGCHQGGNAPNLAAAQGFSVVDPENNMAVTKFSPGKVYRIEIKFNNPAATGPWKNAYRLLITEISTGTNLRAGSIINSGSIGLVTDEGPTIPQRNSRIVTSSVRQSADNLSLEWQAPNDGKVRLRLFRMESNNNNGVGGDRVSQLEESLTLLSSLDNSSGNENEEEDSSDSTEEDIVENSSSGAGGQYQFGDNLTAACGSIRSNQQPNLIALLLMFFGLVAALRLIASLRHNFVK